MKRKNFHKQIIELLDRPDTFGLTARKIALEVIINEDQEINLISIRSCLYRLRKQNKIIVIGFENKEQVYISVKCVKDMIERNAFKEVKLNDQNIIINTLLDLIELNKSWSLI